MSQSIVIHFEPESNDEFIGEDCVEAYEQAVIDEVRSMFPGVDVELSYDSSWGTKVTALGLDETEEEIQQWVTVALERVGNKLGSICS